MISARPHTEFLTVPFGPGNPGRPRGACHRTTLAVEALLEGQAEALTQKAIEAALDGDVTALRLCLDRIAPPRKDAPVVIDLPKVRRAADVAEATGAVVRAVAEGAAVIALLEARRRTLETGELEFRVAAMEARLGGRP